MCAGAGLVSWRLVFTKPAEKDAKKLAAAGLKAGLKDQAAVLLAVVAENPFQNPPPYEKLVGDLVGAYSRRINIQHRLVYQVLAEIQTVKVLRMWSHYE
jgi:Txe/YoeB family toxin of toxin-antitoxin system